MAQCPKCQAVLTDSAQFCAQCGASLSATQAAGRPWVIPVLVAIGLAGVAVAGLTAAGVLRLGGRSTSGSLEARHDAPPTPSLVVPAKQTPPALQETGVGMPDDVRKWLEHLKRIDERRADYNKQAAQSMINQVLAGGFMVGMVESEEGAEADEAKRRDMAKGMVDDTTKFFTNLTADFNSLPPPAECANIAERYNSALLGTQTMLTDVFKAIETASLEKLNSLKGQSFKRVDSEASKCNESITAICAKYKEPNRYAVLVETQTFMNVDGLMTPGTASVPRPDPEDLGGG